LAFGYWLLAIGFWIIKVKALLQSSVFTFFMKVKISTQNANSQKPVANIP
jgi:hypothetical protein